MNGISCERNESATAQKDGTAKTAVVRTHLWRSNRLVVAL